MIKFDTSLSHTTPSTTVLYSTFDDGFSILTNSTYNSNYITYCGNAMKHVHMIARN